MKPVGPGVQKLGLAGGYHAASAARTPATRASTRVGSGERDVESGLPLQPLDLCANLGGLQVPVIAVQVLAAGVFAAVEREAGGVEARQQAKVGARGPGIVAEQLQGGERTGRFVAVDAGG